ncbi:MAG TPA: aldose epimerase family protein [Chitinophagaceae bacterium]|nr:aldose epimerase family protein [Chitinophagaceae bacterium]
MQKLNDEFCFTHSTGEDIYLFTLSNIKGTEVCITNYGAIITSFRIRQPGGKINDIVLGFDKPEDYLSERYLANYPYFGAVIGRYANRIKNGAFSIDGATFLLARNKAPDHLHGGNTGFDKKVWMCDSFSEKKLAIKYKSADGEEGYPGNLDATLRFELTDNDELIYEFTAIADKPTAVNLAHHSYFNLKNGYGTVEDHIVKLNSSHVLEQDDNFVVTGKNIPVAHSHFDFRKPKRIDKNWIGADGYDQTFVLDTEGARDAATGLLFAAEAFCEESQLGLQVYTSEPIVHFYTGKWIPSLHGKNGSKYGSFSGLCFETHKHPNSINIPHFPGTVLRPGELYCTKTMYRVRSRMKS